MKLVPKFRGEVKEGKLVLKDQTRFADYLKNLGTGEIELIIRRKRDNRSLRQNSYYWLILEFIGGELGYSKDEMHHYFRNKLLKDQLSVLDETIYDIKSTKDLNTKRFEDYMSDLRQHASTEMGLYVPLPGEIDCEY